MYMAEFRKRRIVLIIIGLVVTATIISIAVFEQNKRALISTVRPGRLDGSAILVLDRLEVKGRAPKTNYSRQQFGDGWVVSNGCDTRNIILNRDLENPVVNVRCQVLSGVLLDPYTGTVIDFIRGDSTSSDVQIDHVVALSDAWQKGAQLLSQDRRIKLANDPIELLAVDGKANMQKGDGDAATWLPPNKVFRCQYVARQVAVKQKYGLWVTVAEHDAIAKVLSQCPNQPLPTP
ncbi:HNH endonuclease [Candidatus Saccharibacteria bacterium]|nr:HNH endonuclease [Candidatus Saccharibacteria bacterium]